MFRLSRRMLDHCLQHNLPLFALIALQVILYYVEVGFDHYQDYNFYVFLYIFEKQYHPKYYEENQTS